MSSEITGYFKNLYAHIADASIENTQSEISRLANALEGHSAEQLQSCIQVTSNVPENCPAELKVIIARVNQSAQKLLGNLHFNELLDQVLNGDRGKFFELVEVLKAEKFPPQYLNRMIELGNSGSLSMTINFGTSTENVNPLIMIARLKDDFTLFIKENFLDREFLLPLKDHNTFLRYLRHGVFDGASLDLDVLHALYHEMSVFPDFRQCIVPHFTQKLLEHLSQDEDWSGVEEAAEEIYELEGQSNYISALKILQNVQSIGKCDFVGDLFAQTEIEKMDKDLLVKFISKWPTQSESLTFNELVKLYQSISVDCSLKEHIAIAFKAKVYEFIKNWSVKDLRTVKYLFDNPLIGKVERSALLYELYLKGKDQKDGEIWKTYKSIAKDFSWLELFFDRFDDVYGPLTLLVYQGISFADYRALDFYLCCKIASRIQGLRYHGRPELGVENSIIRGPVSADPIDSEKWLQHARSKIQRELKLDNPDTLLMGRLINAGKQRTKELFNAKVAEILSEQKAS